MDRQSQEKDLWGNMKNENGDIEEIQRRFTAYLVSAIANGKINYRKKRDRIIWKEVLEEDQTEQLRCEFETQYHEYLRETMAFITLHWERIEEILLLIDNERLLKALRKLTEKQRKILCARVFGELSFEEIGKQYDMSGKQAEASYHYAIMKLRKKMGDM